MEELEKILSLAFFTYLTPKASARPEPNLCTDWYHVDDLESQSARESVEYCRSLTWVWQWKRNFLAGKSKAGRELPSSFTRFQLGKVEAENRCVGDGFETAR